MDKRKYSHSKKHNQKISKGLKGRIPWNKGIGLEHPSIAKGIETRRIFAKLRELIKLLYRDYNA